ncbi:MAG: DUF3592 domain-containing protein [Bacteroidota bacterium]
MKKALVYRVAKLMWALPVFLLLLALNQAKVAYDLHYTLNNGIAAVADVLEVEVNERVDIPYGYVSLRVALEDGQEIVQEKMSLPYTLLPSVRYEEQLDVRVFLEADQQIVIQQIASTQWKIAAIQSLILIVGFLMAATGVFAWNRLLKEKGDPATREIALDSN